MNGELAALKNGTFWEYKEAQKKKQEELKRNPPVEKPKIEGKKYKDGGCDLMMIIGTALAVQPFNNIVSKSNCPKVLINLENTA